MRELSAIVYDGQDFYARYDFLITSMMADVPLPASIPLLAGGLAMLGFLGWRKRRWPAAAPA